MLPEQQTEAWEAFSATARQNEVLDARTTRLLYLAAAMTAGCYP